jgi:regulator of cell morphogenesis and NO signaling
LPDDLETLAKRPIAELIADPLAVDHAWFRSELERLVTLASRVESSLAGHPQLPAGLSTHLQALRDSMVSHIESEELVVFPLVSSGQAVRAQEAIRGLELEHRDLERASAQTRRLTSGYAAPADGGAEWADLYASLAAFDERKKMHTRIESEILFPRIVYADAESSPLDGDKDKG